MNQLYVQANKTYDIGFVIFESDLRRINDLIREQIKKVNPNPEITYKYMLRFQNGVVGETDKIDTIIEQENEGSKRINSLKIKGEDQLNNSISIEFENVDANNSYDNYSVKYNIKSTDRDWVFVTSSLLEERINKIKRKPLLCNLTINSRLFTLISMMIFVLSFMISSLLIINTKDDYIDEIKSEYNNGKISSTNELIIRFEEAKSKTIKNPNRIFVIPVIVLVIFIIIGFGFHFYRIKLLPLYNFCWGDYHEVFNKTESARKTFNTVIIAGIIVSVIGGIIVNRLL
jgi:hypothetical protein